jgi:hypothetical protein
MLFTAGMLHDSLYANLRDRFGNWVGHSTSTHWLSSDTSVVIVSVGRAQLGEGIITRQTANQDTVLIVASQDNFKDSLRIIIHDVAYSRVQIFMSPDGLGMVDTLRMGMGEDTTLYARGLRADGSGVWDNLAVSWGAGGGIIAAIQPPQTANQWMVAPKDSATGVINISFTSKAGILTDSLYAIISTPITRTFSAWASDDKEKQAGIDNDDFVLLTFDKPVAAFPVTAATIDSIFPLSNGHSWVSGSKSIGQSQWSADGMRILITLSNQTTPPTMAVGDTISCSFAQNKAILTGSFGPPASVFPEKAASSQADLISIYQTHSAIDGVVFAFNSSKTESVKIRIIDMFGRFVADIHPKDLGQISADRFLWNRNRRISKPMTPGIYFIQVFRNEKWVKNIPFATR